MSEQDAPLDEFVLGTEDETDNQKSDQHLPEVGEIPDDWSLVTIDDVSDDLLGGGTPSKSEDDYWGGDIPWASVKDLNGIELSETEDYITESGVEDSATNVAPANSIIISTRMTVGEPFLNKVDMAINQDMKAIIPNLKRANPLFLIYSLWDKDSYLKSLGRGTTVDGITTKDLLLTHLGLPSLEEQRKIASVLYTIDQAIQQTEDIISRLERLRLAASRRLFRYGLDDKDTKDTPMGRFPVNWELRQLGEVGTLINGSAFPEEYQGKSSGSYPFVKVSDTNNYYRYVSGAKNYVSDSDVDELGLNLHPEGSVILPKRGAAIMTNKRRILNQESIIDNNQIGIVGGEVRPLFLYYFLCEVDMGRFVQEGAVKSLTKSFLSKLRVPVPAEETQLEIEQKLDSVDNLIRVEHDLKRQYGIIKRGLMQDLLSGKIRTHDKDIEIVDEVLAHG